MTEKRNCTVCGAENTSEYEYCLQCGAKLPALAKGFVQEAPKAQETYHFNYQNNNYEAANDNKIVTRFCTNCGLQVDPGDNFCNRCAAPLYHFEKRQAVQPQPQPQPQSDNRYTYDNIYDDTDLGVDEHELRCFIGENSEACIKRFKKMKFGGSKASWNWPVFLFSCLLNIPFVWFFYRKMYKVGTILLVVTVVLNMIITMLFGGYLSHLVKYASEMTETTHNYEYDEYVYDEDDFYNEYTDNFYDLVEDIMPYLGGLSALSYISLGYSIFLSIFANNMYFKHCCKKISRLNVEDPAEQRRVLASAGGTSKGKAVALGIVVPIVSCVIGIITFVCAFMVIL